MTSGTHVGGTHVDGTKAGGTKRRGTHLLAAAALLAMFAAPAAAKLVKLTVAGTITSGSDGGNDLIDEYPNPGGGYTEVFAPDSMFGTIGDLTGKAIKFSFIYDTQSPLLPVGTGGVFDDPIGEWALSLNPTITIGGVSHDFLHLEPAFLGVVAKAKLGINDGTPDGLTGDFFGFTFAGNVITTYVTSSFGFFSTLPAGFFSTDSVLPGALPGPGYGLAGAGAGGAGGFDFFRQTCFVTCSLAEAKGDFSLTAISFGAVPEPAAWTLMLAGFAIVGAAARRRQGTHVTA